MSVEKHARRAKRAVVLWRIVGTTVGVPVAVATGIFGALRSLLKVIEVVFDELENAVFVLELDAAKRYYSLTGIDLGVATGENDRYGGLDPELNEKVRQERLTVFEPDEDE